MGASSWGNILGHGLPPECFRKLAQGVFVPNRYLICQPAAEPTQPQTLLNREGAGAPRGVCTLPLALGIL